MRQGRALGLIRPSSRTLIQAPALDLAVLAPLAADMLLKREPRYPPDRPNRQRSPQRKTGKVWHDPPYALLAQ